MAYNERKLASDFSRWLRKSKHSHVLKFTFALELKIKHGDQTLNLKRDFQPQQIPSLLGVLKGCLYHKISDAGRGLKPFDCFNMCHTPAFIGVCWYKPRAKKVLYLLDPRELEDKVKITRTDAEQMAIYAVDLTSDAVVVA